MAAAALSMQTLDVNGLRMQVAMQGSGPLVPLCHGFPELENGVRSRVRSQYC